MCIQRQFIGVGVINGVMQQCYCLWMIVVGCICICLVDYYVFGCFVGGFGGLEVGQCVCWFMGFLVEVVVLYQCYCVIRVLCQCCFQVLLCFVLLVVVVCCQCGGQQFLQVCVFWCELYGLLCFVDCFGVVLLCVGCICMLCGIIVVLQVDWYQCVGIIGVSRLVVLEWCWIGLCIYVWKFVIGFGCFGVLFDVLLQQLLCVCIVYICG